MACSTSTRAFNFISKQYAPIEIQWGIWNPRFLKVSGRRSRFHFRSWNAKLVLIAVEPRDSPPQHLITENLLLAVNSRTPHIHRYEW
jgi:hypothetical protein